MKASTAIEKIKDLLGIELSEAEKVELKQVSLDNGTVVESTSFLPGDEIFIIGEDGEKIPMPVGDYTMADGQKLTVSETGIIGTTSAGGQTVKPKEEEEEEVQASAEETEQASEEEKMYVTKEEFNKAIEEIKNTIVELTSKEEDLAKQESLAKQEVIKEEVKAELSAVEVAEPIAHNPEAEVEQKFQFNYSNDKSTVQSRINKILNNL